MAIQSNLISRETATATSLITDYAGTKSKQVEDPLYGIFSQSSSPSPFSEKCKSKIKETHTVIFKIFNENVPLSTHIPELVTFKEIFTQRYLITTEDDQVLV